MSSAHKVIEDLHRWVRTDEDAANFREIAYTVSAAQKFSFDFPASEENMLFGAELYNEELLHLPFPTCFFEWPIDVAARDNSDRVDRTAMIALEKNSEDVVFECFARSSIHGASRWYPVFIGKFSPQIQDKTALQFNCRHPMYSAFPHHTFGQQHYNRALATAFELLGYCALLNSKSVKQTDVAAPEKLNKHRLKSSKPPISAYRQVTLVLPGGNQGGSGGKGGFHASPRMHWRRGHIRELQNGVKVPVSPCIVGADEGGVIVKEYKAQLAAKKDMSNG